MKVSILANLDSIQIWELGSVFLLFLAALITIAWTFYSKESFQKISLCIFLTGAFMWVFLVVFQSTPVAILEFKRMGSFRASVALVSVCIALIFSWMWIKQGKTLWLVLMIFGLVSMVGFDILNSW